MNHGEMAWGLSVATKNHRGGKKPSKLEYVGVPKQIKQLVSRIISRINILDSQLPLLRKENTPKHIGLDWLGQGLPRSTKLQIPSLLIHEYFTVYTNHLDPHGLICGLLVQRGSPNHLKSPLP